jgi:hypothetical protein
MIQYEATYPLFSLMLSQSLRLQSYLVPIQAEMLRIIYLYIWQGSEMIFGLSIKAYLPHAAEYPGGRRHQDTAHIPRDLLIRERMICVECLLLEA